MDLRGLLRVGDKLQWEYGYSAGIIPRRRNGLRRSPSGAIPLHVRYGIDVEMLRANLALTPAERLRRHQIALNTVEMLRKAKRG